MSTTDANENPNYGTYRRGDDERVAQSLEHAVRYEYDGWSKVGDAADGLTGTDTVAAGAKAAKAAKSAAKPAE